MVFLDRSKLHRHRGGAFLWWGGEPRQKPGTARREATLKDVAEAAAVSRATVSLVLRRSPLVAEATRARVQDAIATVGYVYNRGAARLRSGMSGTIGLIVPEITNPFYAELRRNLRPRRPHHLSRQFQWTVRTVRSVSSGGSGNRAWTASSSAPPEGSSSATLAQLREWRLPFVQILRVVEGVNGDFVATRLPPRHSASRRASSCAGPSSHRAHAERQEDLGRARTRRLPFSPPCAFTDWNTASWQPVRCLAPMPPRASAAC